MPFVKIDTGILRSTVWFDKDARDVFLTALLLAEPFEAQESIPQLEVRSLTETGWSAPPGWYGFVPSSSLGLIDLARVDREAGLAALERLGTAEPESRSRAFDGRRLIRIDGGYLALNYDRYRERDYTAADRAKRYRDRKRHAVTSQSHAVITANVTQADREVEVEEEKKKQRLQIAPATDSPPKCSKAEIEWRLEQTWQAHLRARSAFFRERNGREEPNQPVLTDEIREAITKALKIHDAALLAPEKRLEWTQRSSVGAAGVGIFLSRWHTGDDPNSKKRWLEPWRPWKPQRGKPDPIPGFAALYFDQR